jgi:hypothetical protein
LALACFFVGLLSLNVSKFQFLRVAPDIGLLLNCLIGPYTPECETHQFFPRNGAHPEGTRLILDDTQCESGKGFCDGSSDGDDEIRTDSEKIENEREETDPIKIIKRHAKKKSEDALRNVDPSFGESIDSLKIGGMADFGSHFCLNNTSYETLSHVVETRLKGSLPYEIYDWIRESILIKNVTQAMAFENCTKSLQDTGKAVHIVGWWTVSHDYETNLYTSCILFSGVIITLPEIVVDYKVEKNTQQIATEPCHCGWFYCQTCPVLRTTETKTPVYKKHNISIKQHDALKSYMTVKASVMVDKLKYENRNDLIASSKNEEE